MIWRGLFLTVLWTCLQGAVTPANVLGGAVLAAVTIWLFPPLTSGRSRFAWRKVVVACQLAAAFARELVVANLRLAKDVLTPRLAIQPEIVPYPLDAETDAEIAILANIITLTPGTMSVDVSEDRRTLYIHAIYGGEGLVPLIKSSFEARILELLR